MTKTIVNHEIVNTKHIFSDLVINSSILDRSGSNPCLLRDNPINVITDILACPTTSNVLSNSEKSHSS